MTGQGGGVFARTGSYLTLTDCLISDNTASTFGGGVYGVESFIVLNNTTVTNNSASDSGGGISLSRSIATLNGVTVSDNSANENGGGIDNSFSTTRITNSTVSNNSAGDNFGGGISNSGSNHLLSLSNSTVSGNSVDSRGGGISNRGTMTLSNSTVSGNSAGFNGGGVANIGAGSTATATLTNSMIIGNTVPKYSSEFYRSSAVTNVKNSVFGSSNSSGFNPAVNPSDNNIVLDLSNININSVLLPLADNGGSTLTHALPASSPAISAGDNASCPATDQRGEARDSQCDIGAYEFIDDSSFFVIPIPNGRSVIIEL